MADARQRRAREAAAVAGLMLLGFALRVIHVLATQDNPHHHEPIMDSAVHVEWARALAAGERYAPFADQPFFRAPLYPWFLAGVFALFGEGLLAPRLVQCGLGALSVGLVHAVGRRAFEPAVGLVAAAFAASYWVLVYFDGELLLPTLEVPLDLAALWLTLGLARPGARGRAALAGLAWGVAALARPNVLLFAPCVAGWLVWRERRRGLLPAALFGAGLLLPILPVTAYNTFVQRDFVLISSQGGVNFWIGNNPESDGTTAVAPGTRAGWWEGYRDTIAQAEHAEGRPLRASEVSRHYARRAWQFLLGDPARSLPLLGRKLVLFWTDWEYGNNEDIHFFAHRYSVVPQLSIGFAVLAPLGLLGIALSLRRPGVFPLSAFVALYTASVVAFFVNSRFRVPVLPVLMVFAGYALVWSARALRARRWRPLAWATLFALGFGVATTLPAPERSGSNGHLLLGLAEARRGDRDAAFEHLRRAVAIQPSNVNALVTLAGAEQLWGDPQRAVPLYAEALRLRPTRTDALEGLLSTLVDEGRLDTAEQWIHGVLEQFERRGIAAPEIPYFHLGAIRLARGERAAAREAFAEALRRDPGSVRAAAGLEAAGGARR